MSPPPAGLGGRGAASVAAPSRPPSGGSDKERGCPILLNERLALHDIHDTEAFCRKILDKHLRNTRATLSNADHEDALAYLVATCWEISVAYDPDLSRSFSRYSYNILQRRTIDWYRARYFRDQTSTEWYRRTNPNSKPVDADEQRRFKFPESLNVDQADHRNVAAPDHTGQDPMDFALRSLAGDLAVDCSPELLAVLSEERSGDAQHLDLPDSAADRRATSRDRRAALACEHS